MTLHPSSPRIQPERKHGIALVVTLGILAALVIMAMGFATFMRTERVAARNFIQIARTRQLAIAAMNTMIDKLNYDYAWSQGAYPTSPFRVPGVGDNDIASSTAVDLIYGTADAGGSIFYLPFDVQSNTSLGLVTAGGVRSSTRNVSGRWMNIVGEDNELLGVYSCFIANESGSIDLNVAGSVPYDAGGRTSASNLNLNAISSFRTGSADAVLNTRDNTDLAYYSPAEIKYLKVSGASPWTGSADYPNATPFTSYSRFAQRYEMPFGSGNYTNRAVITGTSAELLARQPELMQAFEEVFRRRGLPLVQAGAAYNNLIDYVDPDFLPIGGEFSFCGEAVPMINEIVMTNKLSNGAAADEYDLETTFAVELWYPFLGVPNPQAYNLTIQAAVSSPDFGMQPLNTTQPVTHSWPSDDTPAYDPLRFKVVTFTIPKATATVSGRPPNMGGALAMIRVRLSDGGTPVDSVGFQGGQAGMVRFDQRAFQSTPATPALGVGSSAQVNDPRVNWDKIDWIVKYGDPGTLEKQNAPWSGYNPDPDGDGVPDNALFVRNAPMVNTGELGFIGLGGTNSWRSFKLTGKRPGQGQPNEVLDPVLDVFTVHTNAYERGLVNLNTHLPEALVAALTGAGVESFPNDPAATPLNPSEAEALATVIVAARPVAEGCWRGLSGIGEVNWKAQFNPDPNNENEMESIIRSSSDMMDVTGNTYTLILRVRAIKDRSAGSLDPDRTYVEGDDATLGEQDLAALIWRDPFTNETRIPFISWITAYDEF